MVFVLCDLWESTCPTASGIRGKKIKREKLASVVLLRLPSEAVETSCTPDTQHTGGSPPSVLIWPKRYVYQSEFSILYVHYQEAQPEPEIPTEIHRPLMWNVSASTWTRSVWVEIKGAWTVHLGFVILSGACTCNPFFFIYIWLHSMHSNRCWSSSRTQDVRINYLG